MEIHGMPEKFWVVTKPSPVSDLVDVCFPCTFERLLRRGRGGLREDDIVAVHADEGEATRAAARLLGDHPVRPQDATFAEVVVNVMVTPNDEGMAAKELGKAAVEAVFDAVRLAEKAGFRHRLEGKVAMGAGTVELRNLQTTVG